MNSDTNSDAAPAPDRRILDILQAHDDGSIITELSSALKQLNAAVQQTGKGGAINLEIKMTPAGKGTRSTLGITMSVKTKLPEPEPYTSIFYTDGDYNLVRDDPNQKRLPFKEVVADKPTATLKDPTQNVT